MTGELNGLERDIKTFRKIVEYFKKTSKSRTFIFWTFGIITFIFLIGLLLILFGQISLSFLPIDYNSNFYIEEYSNAETNETYTFKYEIEEPNKRLKFKVDLFFMSKDGVSTVPKVRDYSEYFEIEKKKYAKITGIVDTLDVLGRFYLCVLLENTESREQETECDTSPFIVGIENVFIDNTIS